jgi:hypothetical protein
MKPLQINGSAPDFSPYETRVLHFVPFFASATIAALTAVMGDSTGEMSGIIKNILPSHHNTVAVAR